MAGQVRWTAGPSQGGLVPLQKRRFLAILASVCGFPCAALQSTALHKSFPFLILRRSRSFLPRKPRRSNPRFWMGTSYNLWH